MEIFDVIIIGSGPVGLAAAIEAKRNDLNYVVLEKGILANSIYNFPTFMRFFTTAALLEIGNHPFPSTIFKPDRQMTLDYYRRIVELENLCVKLHHEVISLKKNHEIYELEVEEKINYEVRYHTFKAKYIVIATGYFDNPNGLGGVKGENGPNTSCYYTEPHSFYRKNVVVIGAGNSGAEAALELYRHGALVTLLHNHNQLNSTLKYWVGPDLKNRLQNNEIQGYMPAIVKEINLKGVTIIYDDSELFIPADYIFILTGFHPNVELFKKWSISINDDLSVSLDDDFATINDSDLYMIGSAGQGKKTNSVFIENGREHAEIAIQSIYQKINKKDV